MLKKKISTRKKRTKPSSRKKSSFPDFCKTKLQPSENLEYEILNYRQALEILKKLHVHFDNNDLYIKKIFQHMRQVHFYMLFLEIKTWREAQAGSYWLSKSKNTGEYIGFVCINKTRPLARTSNEWTIFHYYFPNIPSINQNTEEVSNTLYNYLHNYFKKQKIEVFSPCINIPSTELLKNIDLPLQLTKSVNT